ncbi:NAD-dependent epimerase/dehydratase family protein [Leucobacter sp. Z1108]|uniref:NAD-dependent epimerase/dehydratase family protein n=1 Tax=Leucobacter sp. Z1108 TaxID=3439066 RepID=UPI003F3395E2
MSFSAAPRKEYSLLVLGGTGIIGRSLCAEAATMGHKVTTISRRVPVQSGLPTNVEHMALDWSNSLDFERFLSDRHFDFTIDLLSFDVSQVASTLERIKGSSSHYVFLSSASVSDSGELDSPITEDSPVIETGWTYAMKKIQCELALPALAQSYDQNFTIVRPYITYSESRFPLGQYESHEILNRLKLGAPVPICNEILEASTSITDSRDLGRAIINLISNPRSSGQTVQVVSPETTSWAELFDMTVERIGSKSNLIPVSPEAFLSIFPELSGKVTDRLKNRIYSSDKLYSLAPDFRFTKNQSLEYDKILNGFISSSTPSSRRWEGRIDRLLWTTRSEKHIPILSRYPFLHTGTSSPVDVSKYLVGRSRYLSQVATFLSEGITRKPPASYS